MTNNRPDFYTLYRLFSYRADAFYVAANAAYDSKDYASWEQLCGQRKFNRDMSCILIAMSCITKYATPQLPEKAASLIQFGYISEDDGQMHYARRIDWDYLLG